MEPSSSCCTPSPSPAVAAARRRPPGTRRVRKQKLEEALEQVQRAIEMLRDTDADLGAPLSEVGAVEAPPESGVRVGSRDDDCDAVTSVASDSDYETTQLCDLLKSKVESLEFLQNFNGIQKSVYQNGAVGTDTSWDIIKAVDYWEDDSSDNGYVLVNQEDVFDGITYFMTAYLLSLKQTKEPSPEQLQKALKKTFSVQKRKSKIRKAWDGTKVIYNVASWGGTAVGVYNNRAILAAASTVLQTSFRVISKFM